MKALRNALLISLGSFGLAPAALFAESATAIVVSQRGRLFDPAEITIPKGSTVRFTNEDAFLHQIFVSSPVFSFDSNEQSPGQTVSAAFSVAGDFRVLCGIHPRMSLAVHVR